MDAYPGVREAQSNPLTHINIACALIKSAEYLKMRHMSDLGRGDWLAVRRRQMLIGYVAPQEVLPF